MVIFRGCFSPNMAPLLYTYTLSYYRTRNVTPSQTFGRMRKGVFFDPSQTHFDGLKERGFIPGGEQL